MGMGKWEQEKQKELAEVASGSKFDIAALQKELEKETFRRDYEQACLSVITKLENEYRNFSKS